MTAGDRGTLARAETLSASWYHEPGVFQAKGGLSVEPDARGRLSPRHENGVHYFQDTVRVALARQGIT